MSEELKLNLPNFEGPLDLLLHLIRSQKINIYDIPIVQITNQYLEYLDNMQQIELEIAGDYFIMASTLLKIKSSMLLPKNDFVDEEDDEDPRNDLVEQLLQYQAFKQISEYFSEQEKKAPNISTKLPMNPPKGVITPLANGLVDSSELANVFSIIYQKYRARAEESGVITNEETSVEDQIASIKEQVLKEKEVSFFSLMDGHQGISYLVAMFLALLELIKEQFLNVYQQDEFGDLKLVLNED